MSPLDELAEILLPGLQKALEEEAAEKAEAEKRAKAKRRRKAA